VLFAVLPSPSSGVLQIGPLSVHAYGICIALGALAAVWLATRQWRKAGGQAEDVTAIVTFALPAGIVGARIYHVLTDWQLYRDEPIRALQIWDGGLGIWGGIFAGVCVGLVVAKKRGIPMLPILDVAAPSLAIAQAIGRWGNYFNQELFGKATDLPWAIRIDPENRPSSQQFHETFHPTFFYESLWSLALCGALLLLAGRTRLRPGSLFLIYVAGYTFARFFIENLRVDTAHEVFGMRFNAWVSLILFAGCLSLSIVGRFRSGRTSPPTGSTSDG
jgi:prolipoprotein diacylglyceryl transferase